MLVLTADCIEGGVLLQHLLYVGECVDGGLVVVVDRVHLLHELVTLIAAGCDHCACPQRGNPCGICGIQCQRRDACCLQLIALLPELVPGLCRLCDASLLEQFLVVEVTYQAALGRRCVDLAVAGVGGQCNVGVQRLPLGVSLDIRSQVNNDVLRQGQVEQVVTAAVYNRGQVAGAQLYLDLINVVCIARYVFLLDAVLACVLCVKLLDQLIDYR